MNFCPSFPFYANLLNASRESLTLREKWLKLSTGHPSRHGTGAMSSNDIFNVDGSAGEKMGTQSEADYRNETPVLSEESGDLLDNESKLSSSSERSDDDRNPPVEEAYGNENSDGHQRATPMASSADTNIANRSLPVLPSKRKLGDVGADPSFAGGVISDPFVGTIICVGDRKERRHRWWPAVVTKKSGVPFPWRLEAGKWSPAERKHVQDGEDDLLAQVRYFGTKPVGGWPSDVVHLQGDEVKSFGHTLAEFDSFAMKGALPAFMEAEVHIRRHGTKMEKSLLDEKWISECLLPLRPLQLSQSVQSEADYWRTVYKARMASRPHIMPVNTVVWAWMTEEVFWPAQVLSSKNVKAT